MVLPNSRGNAPSGRQPMGAWLVRALGDLKPSIGQRRDGKGAAVQAGGRNPQLSALVTESGRCE
jgi:hypothetical protein